MHLEAEYIGKQTSSVFNAGKCFKSAYIVCGVQGTKTVRAAIARLVNQIIQLAPSYHNLEAFIMQRLF